MTLKIGEKIKELRKAQNITQDKLANYLNISYQAVSKWENGTALPDVTLLPKIANFFGYTHYYPAFQARSHFNHTPSPIIYISRC